MPRKLDRWGWLAAASVLFLVLRTNGAPRGEPVAEDFDFLHRALLEPGLNLLDGGGSSSFWRPVAHQLYYETLGPLMLSHPGVVSALHILLLAAAAMLLYRVFRPYWDGPSAFAVASFPLLAESTRTLICWPSHFVDLGAFLFVVLAVHERTRNRPWSSWAALLAALLCKELAIVGALLLPLVPPRPGSTEPRTRAFWMAGTGAVVVAWAAAYQWVRTHAGLELPHGLERDAAILSTSPFTRLGWALWNSLRATFSLSLTPGAMDPWAAIGGLLFGLATAMVIGRDPARRKQLMSSRGWILWGAAWCLLSWAALASIYPIWAPNRSQLGSVGLGIVLVGVARIAHPLLLGALVIGRLFLFAAGPETPRVITPEADQRGAFMDYPRLVRLQLLMAATRAKLEEADPHPAAGTMFAWHNLPLSTEYAFGGPHAVQAWYADGTLRCVNLKQFEADPAMPVKAFISYQPPPNRPIVLIDPAALRMQTVGVKELEEGRWRESIAALERADSLQHDRNARVFLGDLAGRRSYSWAQLRQWDRAEAEARAALRAAREDYGARLVLATLDAVRHDRRASLAQIDTVLSLSPGNEEALALLEALRAPVPPQPRTPRPR